MFLTWFQIWTERTVARKEVELDSIGKTVMSKSVDGSGEQVNLQKAIGMAGDIYSSLDWKLGQSKNNETKVILSVKCSIIYFYNMF